MGKFAIVSAVAFALNVGIASAQTGNSTQKRMNDSSTNAGPITPGYGVGTGSANQTGMKAPGVSLGSSSARNSHNGQYS